MDIIVATHNRDKLNEMSTIAKRYPVIFWGLGDLGLDTSIEETGTTFDENALIKARAIYERIGGIVIADDSGLCVDALSGAPGLYSARYGGVEASDSDKVRHLLDQMKTIAPQDRQAAFFCSLAVILSDGTERIYHGVTKGTIAESPIGITGFGYDPVFIPEGETRTMAEMTAQDKNTISHRGRALRLFLRELFPSV
ncbi:MAG: RdgB/HAM1 family non-canonical purine NTP pyrophosphatase [Clostridiaceae bacterium]|jgi:XTP/dITP diphosphohydrolase|nr:RdgB/HAM1 family non-canonical purine NTP pyrophosphatase [Clostridiaceae bacterium]